MKLCSRLTVIAVFEVRCQIAVEWTKTPASVYLFSEHPAAEQILARPYQLQPQKVEGEVERMLGAAGWIAVAAPACASRVLDVTLVMSPLMLT